MNDLNSPGLTAALAQRISDDVDEYCVELYNGGHRTHLGASLIGDECERKLWYVFRWVKAEQFSGRLLRLFNRGHKEEPRLIEWIEGIGVKVWADDLTNNKLFYCEELDKYRILSTKELAEIDDTQSKLEDDVSTYKQHIARAKADGLDFPQYRISAVNGHFGGSLDGVARLPERYQIAVPVLQEFKTSNTKGFKELQKKGVVLAKPQHFAQMSTYGNKHSLTHALYMCVCKETDEIYTEIVKLDWNLGAQMIMKAERVICSQTAPAKLSENPTFWKCKYCSKHGICHKKELCEKNCRSCLHAVPAENAQWICEHVCDARWNIIPKDTMFEIAETCSNYKSITDNVC